MRAEISEQPDAWRRLLTDGQAAVRHAADLFRDEAPKQLVLLARGSSDHAALYAQYVAQIEVGLPVSLATPSVHTVYGVPTFPADSCVLAVSQSGGSEDLVRTLQAAREAGCLTISVTNDPDSALANSAHAHVPILAGPERSVAATKTYTNELLALRLLLSAIGTTEVHLDELPRLAEATLARSAEPIRELAEQLDGVRRMLVVGRGYGYSTAREAALKLMETCYIVAQGLSAADALHGPVAALDGETPLLVFGSAGPGVSSLRDVMAAARAAGAPVEVVGDGFLRGDTLPPLLPETPEGLVPLLEILPAQLLALELATLSGGDPDRPRGLKKVTSTV